MKTPTGMGRGFEKSTERLPPLQSSNHLNIRWLERSPGWAADPVTHSGGEKGG